MSVKTTYFFIAMLWILSYSSTQDAVNLDKNYTLITQEQEFIAGTTISLKFIGDTASAPDLLIHYSLGNTLVSAQSQGENINYEFPPFISNLAGRVNWKLVNTEVSGSLNIIPNSQITKMETYVGPPSIIAGDTDYSMAVSIPLDRYDNAQQDGTAVSFNYNKELAIDNNAAIVKDLIAFDYITSTKKTGKILLAANSGEQFSKEFTVEVQAGLPVDFTLSRKRNHEYADGNQLATFSTSILRDVYGNTAGNGTLVTFYITTSSGAVLQTTGTTIKGIATGTMIHPEKEDRWSVNAAVAGMASSDTIQLEFKPVFESYEVALSQENRRIIVGPLKSFMGQIIPDGVTVSLKIEDKNGSTTYLKQTYQGVVQFELNPDLIVPGTYDYTITAGGITHILKNIKL